MKNEILIAKTTLAYIKFATIITACGATLSH